MTAWGLVQRAASPLASRPGSPSNRVRSASVTQPIEMQDATYTGNVREAPLRLRIRSLLSEQYAHETSDIKRQQAQTAKKFRARAEFAPQDEALPDKPRHTKAEQGVETERCYDAAGTTRIRAVDAPHTNDLRAEAEHEITEYSLSTAPQTKFRDQSEHAPFLRAEVDMFKR